MVKLRPAAWIIIVLAIPALILLNKPSVRSPIHWVALQFWKPFLGFGQSASDFFVSAADNIKTAWSGFQNQKKMEARIRLLENKMVRYDDLLKENQRLSRLLGFKETVPEKALAARIIGWDLSAWRKTLLLNKGETEGIQKGMAVIVPEGLVGRVIETNPASARVLLLIDPDARVSVISSDSRVHGIAMGDGSPFMVMRYIEMENPVTVGEKALSSGVGGHFPKGLLVGVIRSVERDEDGLHLKAMIEPYVPFTKIEDVLCLEYSPGGSDSI
ncbi:MAG: rod shape-determining protein MreC [Candidatus Omnitrophota bacterium]